MYLKHREIIYSKALNHYAIFPSLLVSLQSENDRQEDH